MTEMEISGRKIGAAYPPLVIAEIGINHNGDLETAKAMVAAAAKGGAEIVKHQTHFVEDEMTEEAKSVIPANDERSIWEIMEACALSREEETELKAYAEELGLIYISTPFSRSAADFLASLDVPAFKIGSGECDNHMLIRHIASFGKPIIMSTGMQSVGSLEKSVAILDESGCPYALLECTNLYPSPASTVSLQGIGDLRRAFPNAVIGFSDHSIGPEMCFAAVGLGASILERHFVDDRYRSGPDVVCSMDPLELSHLISRSKEIHTALHNPKQQSEMEAITYKFARSSVVADRDLEAGQIITEKDVWARRPGNGEIAGYDIEKVIGRKLIATKTYNEQLKWTDLE